MKKHKVTHKDGCAPSCLCSFCCLSKHKGGWLDFWGVALVLIIGPPGWIIVGLVFLMLYGR